MKSYQYQCYTYSLFFNKDKTEILQLLLKNDNPAIRINSDYKENNIYIVGIGIEKTTDPILYRGPDNYNLYEDIEPLLLEENQELYRKVFILFDFSNYAINGEVLAYVFRTGREVARESLKKAFYNIFGDTNCEIICLASKKPLEEYLKEHNRKVIKIKCKVAQANFNSSLFYESEQPKEIEQLTKMKKRFGSDILDFELSMGKNKFFSLEKIIEYFKPNFKNYESVSISIDEAGHIIEQKFDEILIKGFIDVKIEKGEIDEDEVFKLLKLSWDKVIVTIKDEFSFKQ